MSLLLDVISYQGDPLDSPSSFTVDDMPVTIGRRSDNHWVLPDPENFLSGHHASVDCRDGRYFMTDSSSNGVFINQSPSPIGKGLSVELVDGDHIRIGDYDITVSLIASSPAQNTPDFPDNPFPDNPFGDDEAEMDDDPFKNFGMDIPEPDIEPSPEKGPGSAEYFPQEPDPFADFLSPSDSGEERKIQNAPISPLEEPFEPQSGKNHQKTSSDNHKLARQTNRLPSQTQRSKPGPEKTTTGQPSHPATATASSASIHKFLQGAGLDNSALADTLSDDTFYIIGKLLRTSVQGAMEVLRSRTDLQKIIGTDVTTMKAKNNNPIKFSVSGDEALTRLLTPHTQGYMQSVDAIEEAFDDMKAHQMAVLAGMQSALQSVLKRFNPEVLEQRLEKKSPISAAIPIHRQAKLWGQFEELYETIEVEAQDDFNQLFGRAFARAYEEQVRKIKQSKRGYD